MENNEAILKKLTSNEPQLLNEAIDWIKENGDLSMVNPLLDLLESTTDHPTNTAIINTLVDIKENAFREILTNRIKKTTTSTFKALLLRICWESSLDYSGNIDLFTEIFMKDDFMTAFEAFTVIENMFHNLDEEKQNQIKNTLQSAHLDEEKKIIMEGIMQENKSGRDD